MIRKLQEWLGEQAVIDVPNIAAWLIGIRHSHFNWRETGKRDIPCPKVHRSVDEWRACTSTNIAAWQADTIKRLLCIPMIQWDEPKHPPKMSPPVADVRLPEAIEKGT